MRTLPLIALFLLSSPALTGSTAVAADDFPAGDDGFPEGEDGFPEGEDGGAAPSEEEPMPSGEEDELPPTLVAVPTAKACTLKPRSEGYVQVMLDRARSLDLHGVDAAVSLQEDRGGCVAEVDVDIDLTPRCGLSMRFEHSGDGRFDLTSLRFQADECQELSGLPPGRYTLHQGSATLDLDGQAKGLCVPKGRLRIDGRLKVKSGRRDYELNLDGLRVVGDLPLMQNDSVSCRKRRRAAPVPLSSDRPRSKRKIWPWVVGGVGLSAVAGGVTWYLMTREAAPGSLTLRLQ